jgi:hypothetical protein
LWFKRQRRPSWQRKPRPRCPSTKKTEEAVANILDSVYTARNDGRLAIRVARDKPGLCPESSTSKG